MLRIHVDFNAMSQDGKMIWINTDLRQDLVKELHPGLRVVLYEPNQLEVEATVVLEKATDGKEWWYGVPDWSREHDLEVKND
ncbi:MAG: hypothetical protein JNJ78_24030 [Anaerolineae bacterium]|nr:hypothetical protein [Anaerolineae bacterium]